MEELKHSGIDPRLKFKADHLVYYGRKYRLNTFIETGTYFGDTTLYMIRHTRMKIITIELGRKLHARAQGLFAKNKRVTCLLGDSVSCLKTLDLTSKPCLFWLDAHYSGGITAMGMERTPIYQELGIVLRGDIPHVVVIDDMNYMPSWGISIDRLKAHVLRLRPKAQIIIDAEVMVILPD